MSKLPVAKGESSLATVSPLQLYLREIAKYSLLNPEEEYELAVEYFSSGDRQAAQRLITSNLRLVVKIANDFKHAQSGMLDMIQEGNYGLMQAVKRYNPYKGVKLSSYAAWWIRAYILKYIMDNKSQVKIGTTAAQRKLFFNLRKEADRLLKEYECVDPKLIAESLNVREKDVIEMQQRLSSPEVSLDAPVSGKDEGNGNILRGELIADDRPSFDELLSDAQHRQIFREHVEEFRQQLSERDREFFERRIMSDDPLTLQQLGDQYGVSRERARQIEARIIRKLREFVVSKGTLDVTADTSS